MSNVYLEPGCYLPHKKPMVLIDKVIEVTDNSAICQSYVNESSSLAPFLEGKELPFFYIIELISQAIGVWSGFKSKQNNVALTNWPYLTITPTQNETYQAAREGGRCNCNAIAGNGIEDVDVTTPVVQGTNAQFTAFIKAGYKFNGWYSDSEYQQLISINNPASIITPINPNTSGNDFSDYPLENSYTLYAKAESTTTSTTGIYLKCNGSWIKAKSVFKKTNGAWVKQEDLSAIFSGESSGTASNYVYGGSV